MFRAGNGELSGNWTLMTAIIENNQTFTVPANIKNNQLYVRIFGAGGGGATWYGHASTKSAGGGGGWMNNGFIKVSPGEAINIIIGGGGRYKANDNGIAKGDSGGITSFGTYLSANGGDGALCNNSHACGGNGGSGGGADRYNSGTDAIGGRGYQFGGGGAIRTSAPSYVLGGVCGQSGIWGGNGANASINAENGINTISSISETDLINADGIGYGIAGIGKGAGGGGYGANGGNGITTSVRSGPGGGGGYGASGYGGIGPGAGGGGAYGPGGSGYNGNGTRGGGGSAGGNGGNGICFIWYYEKS